MYSGIVWNDADGKSIQAHAAGILIDPIDKSYWWYGESLETPIISNHGVNCYHSKDLLNWINIGEVLGQKQVYIKDHSGPYILSRPKVVWNEKTQLFVMWFHLDNNDCTYRYVGVATSSTPNGSFTFIDSFQPDGIPSLDMSLYQDNPGTYFYIYMGDRWDSPALVNATYIWLPYHFHSDTNVTLEWIDKWTLNDY
jgi:hypothetical protein